MSTFEMRTPYSKNFDSEFFKRAILYSVAAHFSLLLVFTVKSVFFKGEPLIYEGAVRVDLVALPDKMTAQATPAEAPPAPPQQEIKKETTPTPKPEVKKETSKSTDTINLEKSKSKEQAAIKKLKAMDALERIKRDLETENRMKSSAKLFKGNQLSSGSELKGLSQIENQNYVGSVKRHIYEFWALPEWLAHKPLKAQVLAKFDAAGNLTYKQIVKSSGNPSYDEVVLEAIEKSSPVPAPPEKLARIISAEGILIGFPE